MIRVARYLHCKSRSLKISSEAGSELHGYKNYYKALQDIIGTPDEKIALQSPTLSVIHKRLRLPKEFSFSTLARCLTCRSSFNIKNSFKTFQHTTVSPLHNKNDNYGLNVFGKNLLTFFVINKLIKKYPRLPTPVLNAAVDAYIKNPVLAHIGKTWGIETEKSTVMERYLKKEPIHVTLGKLRFFDNTLKETDGIEIIMSQNKSPDAAMALAVRSIIAALWASTKDQDKVSRFIEDHVMSRKLDVSRMFQFEQPTRELAALCRREGLERPISKLLVESGRLSKAPLFIVGVFSGDEKLGEGFGSSLKEAKARAAVDALMKWYCYEPIEGQHILEVDPGQVLV